jgi:hypothetical protein
MQPYGTPDVCSDGGRLDGGSAAASFVQARRADRIDLIRALRQE